MLKKKFKSTVTCVAFHPTNSQLIACGSSDFKCRVYSTFSSDVDAAPDAGPFQVPVEFGETYAEMAAMGWINAVAWSPSGRVLCFAGHDSSVHFAQFSPSGPVVQTLRLRDLPLACLVFASEHLVVGAGYDFNPVMLVGGKSILI
jgi:actin related protein 2/3 complex subunit 1A/1B